MAEFVNGWLLVLGIAVAVGCRIVLLLAREVRECHADGFAAWPWERCQGVWARTGDIRRCDLLRGHVTDVMMDDLHYHDGGLDPIWWLESEVVGHERPR